MTIRLTTQPFRDGAPFLFQTEPPPTFCRSLRCFHILRRNVSANLIPFFLIAPPVATVCLLESRSFTRCKYQTPPCHIRLFASSPLVTLFVPPCTHFTFSYVLLTRGFYPLLLCHTGTPVHLLFPPPPGYSYEYLFLLGGTSRSPTRNRSRSVFAKPIIIRWTRC